MVSIHNSTPSDNEVTYFINSKQFSQQELYIKIRRKILLKEILYVAALGIITALRALLFFKYNI